MALTITSLGGASSTTSGATLTSPAITANVGDVVLFAVAADNAGTSGVASLSNTITDALGNTWVNQAKINRTAGAANDGTTLGIYTCLVTNAFTGQTVDFNFSPNTTSKAVRGWTLSPGAGEAVSINAIDTVGLTGSTTTHSANTVSVNNGDTIFGLAALESRLTVTMDADTTNGNWSTQQRTLADTTVEATSQQIFTQNKTVNATGNQTFDPTTASNVDSARSYIVVGVTIVSPPPGGEDTGQPTAKKLPPQSHFNSLNPNLLGKDKFYEAGHFPTYDYPNPPQKPRSLDLLTWTSYFRIPFPPIRPQEWPVPQPFKRSLSLLTHIDSLKPQLIGQDNVPIRPQEWPVPPSKPRWNGLLSWSFSVNVPPTVAPPVRAFEWPVPQPPQRSIDLRTHIDTLKLSLIGQDTFFGAPGQAPVYDWQLPPRATARSVDLLSSFSFTLPPAPVAAIPPGKFDGQNPPLRAYPSELRTWINSFVFPIVLPPGKQDAQNPPLRSYPAQLRTFTSSFVYPIIMPPKGQDLSIPPFPKPRMDFIRFAYLNNTVITPATVRPPLNVVLTVPPQRLRSLELLSYFNSARPTPFTSTELVFAYISG